MYLKVIFRISVCVCVYLNTNVVLAFLLLNIFWVVDSFGTKSSSCRDCCCFGWRLWPNRRRGDYMEMVVSYLSSYEKLKTMLIWKGPYLIPYLTFLQIIQCFILGKIPAKNQKSCYIERQILKETRPQTLGKV